MLDLIDLDIPSLGYSRFISSWLYQGKKENFLVDPGPACTIGHLLAELEKRGVSRLDWILLTHIHMDHAGGIGHLVKRFPGARVVCHEKAVKHLKDPERLWEGSLKVLGEVARVYGEIKPVPSDNIMCLDTVPFEEGIQVISTPGHAAHHQCFVAPEILFCGELFGIFHQLEKGGIYLRPATPPVFVLEDFLNAMDAVDPYVNRRICFAHYGFSEAGKTILKMARQQLQLWVNVIAAYRGGSDMERIIQDLSDSDPVFARKSQLPPPLYEREIYFSVNSIRGILKYLS